MTTTPLIQLNNVSKSFTQDENQKLLVLDEVNLQLNHGEIVALLGKSGSGKSTLLRIVAGLIEPTCGDVRYRGENVLGPVPGISMVFQSFALMPWLTVLQNVELGLEAQGVARAERRARALEAIDIIGLDGFESALPRELSGGMQQRVGFARALVVNPDVLLMDEPFSALDVLTSENLRSDLLDLWESKKTNTHGILFVSHNIEEAALLADRIIVFGNDPGYVRAEVNVDLPHPRNEQEPRFRRLVDHIYTLITTHSGKHALRHSRTKPLSIGHRLPDVDPSELSGLMETLIAPEFSQRVDLPELAESLHMDVDDLFPITEALELLGFAKVSEGDIELTAIGKTFADADVLERKPLFAKQLVTKIPLAQHIRQTLDERRSHRASEERFLSRLEDYLSEKEAERVLRTAIDWGRYAEMFAYDYNTGMLSLENPES